MSLNSQTLLRLPVTPIAPEPRRAKPAAIESNLPQDKQAMSEALLRQYVKQAFGHGNLLLRNHSVNLDHVRKLYFIHNPKAMGTSMKAWLGLPVDTTQHNFPTLCVSAAMWEEYTTVLVVRHPLDRFLSSYQFHRRSAYAGKYLKTYPDLKTLDPRTYFQRMTQCERVMLAPQWKWADHLNSNEPVDFLIKMGEHEAPLRQLADRLDLQWPMPRINRSSSKKAVLDEALQEEIEDFYSRDYEMFGYARKGTGHASGREAQAEGKFTLVR